MIAIQELQDAINYQANNPSWLYTAITHKSYFKNNKGFNWGNNEKIEFLGDAVLDVIMADILMDTFPDDNEGNLSKKRASLVNVESLSKISLELGLDQFLLIGEGEETQGLRENKRILAGTLEAVIGGIYKDRGFRAAYEWVQTTFRKTLSREFSEHDFRRDFKTRFQELAQEKWKITPVYKVKEVEGPDHKKMFKVEVYVGDDCYGEGSGDSKKSASQQAAEVALVKIDTEEGSSNE